MQPQPFQRHGDQRELDVAGALGEVMGVEAADLGELVGERGEEDSGQEG